MSGLGARFGGWAVGWVKRFSATQHPLAVAAIVGSRIGAAHQSLTQPACVTVLLALSVSPAHAADPAFGQYLAGECVTCHRIDGENKGIPAIVGWPEDQFVAVMKSYKDKDRPNVIMQTIASKLNDQELAALAAYYASLKAKP
jgi:cytochrome c553